MTNPWTVLIIKMFMFAKGFKEPLSHPRVGLGTTSSNGLAWALHLGHGLQ